MQTAEPKVFREAFTFFELCNNRYCYYSDLDRQYSICGKIRVTVTNVFLTIYQGSVKTWGLRDTRGEEVNPSTPDKSNTVYKPDMSYCH